MRYRLGLDIGITSVGWSVVNLDEKRIEDLGVRIFNAAENPKDGSSLAAPRREARGRRRLLRRKAYRVNRVRDLILEKNILSKEELDVLFKNKDIDSVWNIRVKGLDTSLNNHEFAKLLINFCKRRGFKSNRKNEINDKEAGIIITSIRNNEENMKNTNSRTIGEYIFKQVKDSEDKHKPLRNKLGQYNMCISRTMIREEIHTLFEKQRSFNNKFASDEIEDLYLEIFDSQRPYSKFEDLERMVGYCTFEKGKYRRAPKNSISAEEFVLYDNLNKISIIKDGDKRKLTKEERNLIVKEAFNKKEIKYSKLRSLLKLDESEYFSTLTYSLGKSQSQTENCKFTSLKGYNELKKAIEHGINKSYWETSVKDNRKMLNEIAYVLSLGKTDEEITNQLRKRDIPDEIIDVVLDISFSKFANLSIEAINKILPYMRDGHQYSEACEMAGYDFKAIYQGEKSYKLPVIKIDEIVNPVVNRALAQTRKVINAIIDKYGSPIGINVELARELSKNFKDRKAIEKEQKENRDNRDKIRKEIVSLMRKEPTGIEVLKYRLWEQQKNECAYSQLGISINNLFEPGMCEIDHIIPFSRSFDDSLNNKVLVLSKENQNKTNKIPFEYFGDDEERWHRFEVWVTNSKLPYKKKQNLLKKKFSVEEQRDWKARNLQDTKYICKYIANYINNRLIFAESESKQKVITVNGRATAYLRAKWGLTKVREDGDKHHALDATVVAVTTQGMIAEISKYSKAGELRNIRQGDQFVDIETGEIVKLADYKYLLKDRLPRPWPYFSEELKLRLSDSPKEELKKWQIETYDQEFIKQNVESIFVSRVPFRKVGGRLFKETVYSKNSFKDNKFITKKKLQDLKISDMENIHDYHCDKKLYDAIEIKLKENNGDGKKAFKEEFRKPTKSGKLGPVVRSIKIVTKPPFKDGIELNEGVVAKNRIARIDIYEKDRKYFVVPVYCHQIANGIIPKKAAVAAKSEKDWIYMDESYVFKFSLYKNDLIEIKYGDKKKGCFGYYDSFDIGTSALTIEEHDSSKQYRGVGIKQGVTMLNKYEVTVLGKFHKVKRG